MKGITGNEKLIQAIAPFAVVVLLFFALFAVAKQLDDAHDTKHVFASDRFQIVEATRDGLYREVIFYDTETGVQYLWVGAAYSGGLTPLLDADGNVTYYHP